MSCDFYFIIFWVGDNVAKLFCGGSVINRGLPRLVFTVSYQTDDMAHATLQHLDGRSHLLQTDWAFKVPAVVTVVTLVTLVTVVTVEAVVTKVTVVT